MAGKQPSERLTQEEILLVKKLVWEGGLTQKQIAIRLQEEYGKQVDQASVSRIKRGTLGRNVPWPDGFTGAFNKGRKDLNWSSAAAEYSAMPEEMQNRMLWAVNSARLKKGIDELPPVDVTYQSWIQAALLDPTEEVELMILGRQREDNRRATVQKEFNDIVKEKMDLSRQRIYQEILTEDVPQTNESPTAPHKMEFYNAVTWDEVLASWYKLQIVKTAILQDDPFLKEAICIFKYSNSTADDQEFITKRALSIKKLLQESPHLHTIIKGKHTK